MVNFDIAITSLPNRMDSVIGMIERLGKQYRDIITIVLDENRLGCWETSKGAWEKFNPNKTHHIVMQDDILFCKDFVETMNMISLLLPNNPVLPYSNNQIAQKAMDRGDSWFILRGICWGQALMMPNKLIPDFIDYVDERVGEGYESYDGRLNYWVTNRNIDTYCTVPSLVQHNLDYKSAMGHNACRTFSKYFIGEVRSGLSVNWMNGIAKPYRTSSVWKTIYNYLKEVSD